MKPLGVKSARDIGAQLLDNPHHMVGQDGAYSVPLNGETLWFFGDTLVGERVPGESLWYPGGQPVGARDMSGRGGIQKLFNNTGLLSRDHTGRYGLKNYRYICDKHGQLRPLIPLLPDENPDEYRIWCMHGCCVGGRVYLAFIKVHMLEEIGPFPVNFEVIGSGLAVGSPKDWTFTRVHYAGSDIYWPHNRPQFGTVMLRGREDNWLYIYGVLRDGHGVQRCYLARVLPEALENRDRYEFLVSPDPRWTSEASEAMSLFSGPPNELSVSFNPYLNGYLAVHSMDLTGRVVARTAEHPWGPWGKPVTLWQVSLERDQPLPYPTLVYAGKEHPALRESGGRIIYITYVEFEEYFPHLVEIGLE